MAMIKFPALTHYSHEHIDVVQPLYSQLASASPKPRGFWVSIDSDPQNWRSWCETEDFHSYALEQVHDVALRADANILLLDSAAALDEFTEAYGEPFHSITYIRWHRVAAMHSGIIIAPYQWSRRLNDRTGWYYGWDCASGCIWDVSVIERIALRQQAEAA
jgi:hypothetical protein